MGLLLNRVKAVCNAAGTGAVTPGVAVPPYQTWAGGGASSGCFYDYLIEQGTAWEMGVGLYNGTTISRPGPGVDPWFQSSTGSLLSVTSSDTIACVANKRNYHPYEALGAFPAPHAAAFTQIGFGAGVTLSDYGNGVHFHNPAQTNPALAVMAAPAAPFSVYMRGHAMFPMQQFNEWGIVLMNSGSGKLLTSGPSTRQNSPQFGLTFNNDRWNSQSSYNSTNADVQMSEQCSWVRADVGATTITYYGGFDGIGWAQMATESLSTFIGSVDTIGILCIAGLSGGATDLFCQVFTTAPPVF